MTYLYELQTKVLDAAVSLRAALASSHSGAVSLSKAQAESICIKLETASHAIKLAADRVEESRRELYSRNRTL